MPPAEPAARRALGRLTNCISFTGSVIQVVLGLTFLKKTKRKKSQMKRGRKQKGSHHIVQLVPPLWPREMSMAKLPALIQP